MSLFGLAGCFGRFTRWTTYLNNLCCHLVMSFPLKSIEQKNKTLADLGIEPGFDLWHYSRILKSNFSYRLTIPPSCPRLMDIEIKQLCAAMPSIKVFFCLSCRRYSHIPPSVNKFKSKFCLSKVELDCKCKIICPCTFNVEYVDCKGVKNKHVFSYYVFISLTWHDTHDYNCCSFMWNNTWSSLSWTDSMTSYVV